MFGDVQFAGRIEETADDENERNKRPGNLLFPWRQMLFQKIVESKEFDKFQGKPGATKNFFIFDANAIGVDFDPFGFDGVLIEELGLNEFRFIFSFGGLLDFLTGRLLELAKVGDNTVPGLRL